MAQVNIIISDKDLNNVDVTIHVDQLLPKNPIQCTNAQLIAKDTITFLQQLCQQLNDKATMSKIHNELPSITDHFS